MIYAYITMLGIYIILFVCRIRKRKEIRFAEWHSTSCVGGVVCHSISLPGNIIGKETCRRGS